MMHDGTVTGPGRPRLGELFCVVTLVGMLVRKVTDGLIYLIALWS